MSGDLSTTKPACARRRLAILVVSLSSWTNSLGQLDRFVVGVALGQVDQNLGDDVLLIRQVDAGQDIGTILLPGQARGLVVGGPLGQRVDRGAPHRRGLGEAVGVQGDEQLAAALPGDLQAIAQPHDPIVVRGS